MAGEVRFWEGAAARRDDAPQAKLEAVLLLLREDEPAWATIDALLHERVDGSDAWKLWQRALTALHVRAAKGVQAARAAGHLLVDDPAVVEMRRAGWEPWVELAARLDRMATGAGWGRRTLEAEVTCCGCGVVLRTVVLAPESARMDCGCGPAAMPALSRLRLTWEGKHDGGAQRGQQVRCQIDVHKNNPVWSRIRWASWREGMKAARPTLATMMGVDGDEAARAFGAS